MSEWLADAIAPPNERPRRDSGASSSCHHFDWCTQKHRCGRSIQSPLMKSDTSIARANLPRDKQCSARYLCSRGNLHQDIHGVLTSCPKPAVGDLSGHVREKLNKLKGTQDWKGTETNESQGTHLLLCLAACRHPQTHPATTALLIAMRQS
jgi:hypothetical protein